MFNKDELNRLYKYSLSLCHNEQEAYDLLHSSLEKVLTKADKVEIRFPIRYMMRTVRNTYLNKLRDTKKEIYEDMDQHTDNEEALEDIVIKEMDAKTILNACNESEREILYLWAFEGMTYEEMAGYLEISKGTLLTKVHNLKKRIIKKFG